MVDRLQLIITLGQTKYIVFGPKLSKQSQSIASCNEQDIKRTKNKIFRSSN